MEPQNNLGRIGCNCTDNCRDKLKCNCWKLTVKLAIQRTVKANGFKRYSHIGYENMKLSEMLPNGIVECGGGCKCCANKCANHVVQNGIQHKLEVFKTKSKGWGVRTTMDLPKGAFVCNYIGDVIEEKAADQRSTTYQFKLPKITNSKDDSETDTDTSSESDSEPEAKISINNDTDDDDVLQPFVNYFPPMLNGNADYFPNPIQIKANDDMKVFFVDGLKNGNISRFINVRFSKEKHTQSFHKQFKLIELFQLQHSCDPNLFCQVVFVGDDKRFPIIAFFANDLIKANEEITIDYSYDLNDEKPVKCHCGADNCRKRLV